MPSKVTPMPRKMRRKECAFCKSEHAMLKRPNNNFATTVCDFGWPEDPCNAPICPKHTQQVTQDDGKHVKEFCPKHKQEIAEVASA